MPQVVRLEDLQQSQPSHLSKRKGRGQSKYAEASRQQHCAEAIDARVGETKDKCGPVSASCLVTASEERGQSVRHQAKCVNSHDLSGLCCIGRREVAACECDLYDWMRGANEQRGGKHKHIRREAGAPTQSVSQTGDVSGAGIMTHTNEENDDA